MLNIDVFVDTERCPGYTEEREKSKTLANTTQLHFKLPSPLGKVTTNK